MLNFGFKKTLKHEIVDVFVDIERAIKQVKFDKQVNAKQTKVTVFQVIKMDHLA